MDAEARRVSLPLHVASLKIGELTISSALNDRAARKYPEQYQTAQGRYPAPVDY